MPLNTGISGFDVFSCTIKTNSLVCRSKYNYY